MSSLVCFPFIGGRARSGTTLLRAMLDTHPDMAIPEESHFVVRFGANRQRYEREGAFAVDTFLTDLLAHRWFQQWDLPGETVAASLRASPPADFPEAVRRVYELFAGEKGKTRYGDKTPRYVLNMLLLADLFPESRFVHVIRDGRDVALSNLEAGLDPRTVAGHAWFWRRYILRGRRDGQRLGPRRYLEMRYEDFLEDPEGHLREICTFIELTFDPVMLRYFERADEWVQDPGALQRHRRLFLPPTKGLRDWRREMPKEDVAVFEAVAGDVLSALGYERAWRKVPLSARVHARKDVLDTYRDRARRRAHRLRRAV